MSDLARNATDDPIFCTFRAQQRLYGIDVSHVREISTQLELTPIPQAPPIVRGLANLRSRIFLVLDLGPALGGSPSVCTAESRLIVLQDRVAENLGLLVDQGGDIVRAPLSLIEEAASPSAGAESPQGDQPSSVVVGVCKLDSELMMIVDPAKIIDAMERAIR